MNVACLFTYFVLFNSVTDDGRSKCTICNKVFSKPSQLHLHVNIHYFERPYRCDACAVSFRTRGHLQKHERSVSHHNKVCDDVCYNSSKFVISHSKFCLITYNNLSSFLGEHEFYFWDSNYY